MWSKVARETGIPWRAAEAMHWQLGQLDMAQRAGVTPLLLQEASIESAPPTGDRRRPARKSLNRHSMSANINKSEPMRIWCYGQTGSSHSRAININSRGFEAGYAKSIVGRSGINPRPLLPSDLNFNPSKALIRGGIPTKIKEAREVLPSLAEMVAGVGPYNTPEMTLRQ